MMHEQGIAAAAAQYLVSFTGSEEGTGVVFMTCDCGAALYPVLLYMEGATGGAPLAGTGA